MSYQQYRIGDRVRYIANGEIYVIFDDSGPVYYQAVRLVNGAMASLTDDQIEPVDGFLDVVDELEGRVDTLVKAVREFVTTEETSAFAAMRAALYAIDPPKTERDLESDMVAAAKEADAAMEKWKAARNAYLEAIKS